MHQVKWYYSLIKTNYPLVSAFCTSIKIKTRRQRSG